MTPDDIAMQAPATLADRFHIAYNPQTTRITFQEATGDTITNRAAIAMSTASLMELRNALSDVIDRIEGRPIGNLADQISDVTPTQTPLMDALTAEQNRAA